MADRIKHQSTVGRITVHGFFPSLFNRNRKCKFCFCQYCFHFYFLYRYLVFGHKTYGDIDKPVVFTQLSLRILRFSELHVDFYLVERAVGLINMIAFIFLNINLLFKNHENHLYRIIGAINVYLLVAIYGAFGFELIQLINGDSISGANELTGLDSDFASYIYFSMVSLTTVGFGDYFPVNIFAKMLSVFLAMVGILYPAIVIARLIHPESVEKK